MADILQNNIVKIVDFAPFFHGSDKQNVSKAILNSFKTTGLVYLVSHTKPDRLDVLLGKPWWLRIDIHDARNLTWLGTTVT